MIIYIICGMSLLVLAYCILMLYRNELVGCYQLRYLKEFGPYRFEANMPSYEKMLNSHITWNIVRLRRYVKRGTL